MRVDHPARPACPAHLDGARTRPQARTWDKSSSLEAHMAMLCKGLPRASGRSAEVRLDTASLRLCMGPEDQSGTKQTSSKIPQKPQTRAKTRLKGPTVGMDGPTNGFYRLIKRQKVHSLITRQMVKWHGAAWLWNS